MAHTPQSWQRCDGGSNAPPISGIHTWAWSEALNSVRCHACGQEPPQRHRRSITKTLLAQAASLKAAEAQRRALRRPGSGAPPRQLF